MKYENNPKSIKYHVRKYLENNKDFYNGKKVIDFPAGNGITSRILKDIGAEPIAMDLFPEYFELEDVKCERANIREELPVSDESVDALVCQEGIEHFSDQYESIREFNRVLKPNGRLLITTPNYSNLRSRLSYMISESEKLNKIMPPNELDSIWMSDQTITNEIYFGHIFLIGIQKLRVLAKLAGFKILKVHFVRARTSSVLLLPLFYPFILLSNYVNYWRNMKRNKDYDRDRKKKIYGEVFKYACSPKILVDGHLMVEFEKEMHYSEVAKDLKSRHKEFGRT